MDCTFAPALDSEHYPLDAVADALIAKYAPPESVHPDSAKLRDSSPEAHAENLEVFARKLDLRDVTLLVHDFGGFYASRWDRRDLMRELPVLII